MATIVYYKPARCGVQSRRPMMRRGTMKVNIKAALLSAFVLPGLGQIVSGRRIKGVVIIVLANIFLLAAFVVLLRGMGPVLLEARLTGRIDAVGIAKKLEAGAPAARMLLAGFAGLWVFAVIDALLGRVERPHDERHDGPTAG